MAEPGVLVVDDDPSSASYLALALHDTVSSVRTASSGVAALLAMEEELPALVISDLQMPDMDGIELLVRVKERWPNVLFMLITVEQDIALVVEAVQRGAVNYLVKPVSPSVLQAATTRALAHRPRGAPPFRDASAPEILGVSPAIVRVRHLVVLAGRSDVNVIVTGETGTGKELVSRAIHRLSALAAGPFVAHNCAVTPPEMFDAEFFGHRRGAFTGADRDRAGLLREADGGVLFLDELECLSLANQAKLLRVLDDGEVRPLGSEQSRPVFVRFLAATNQLPEHMVSRRELREDLYYRLRGFEIHLPPLRERREDIPILSEHFLAPKGVSLTPAALESLLRGEWPGNIRQLRNVLRSASTAATAGRIDVPDLDLASSWAPRRRSGVVPSGPARDDPARMSLEEAERRAIAHALDTHGGNLSRAAEALGIHRSTLRRKIRALGIGRAR